jgi:4-hydroxybutyrate CoA-transferase
MALNEFDRRPDRVSTAVEAVGRVTSGDRVYLQGGAATPHTLVEGLMKRASSLHDIEIVHLHTEGAAPYTAEGMEGRFRHNALFIGSNARDAVMAGRADYTPIFLSEIPSLFTPGGALPLDVALIHVTPPDANGYCSLGVSVDCALAAATNARLVIAQVNSRMPRTRGHRLHISSIDVIFEEATELPEHEVQAASTEAQAIGRHIAQLVEDGSTLQLGIGSVPDAVLAELGQHRDLGIHTEMFTDSVLPLVHAGVITGARKTVHPGVIVSAFVLGSRSLYDFVDGNHEVELHPADYTNDPAVIAANDRMVAINAALSVDLTGQVAADSLGARFYSGIGGQVDFNRGAAHSKGGKPIICLPSTAKDGTVSRICPELWHGSGVVTTRGDVHWVATEFGARDLHGRTVRERARMLIDIAHPKFQAELEQRAGEMGFLGSTP